MKPRVGHIQFINCYPLYYGLIEKKFPLDIELIKGYPSDLNRMLLANALDMAWIPSIAYARNYSEYVLLPDISVSSFGEVKSIFLFSKYQINELSTKKIAMTNTSATSQVLLQVLMANHIHSSPHYFSSTPELGAMLMEADAALLIGDDALRAFYKNQGKLFIYDLGKLWQEFSSLPMVFAVWAIREEWAYENRDILRQIKAVFKDSICYSLDNIEMMATKAAQWEDFDTPYLIDYFRCLEYDFDEFKQTGLLEYYRQAMSLGFIDEVPPLKFLDLN